MCSLADSVVLQTDMSSHMNDGRENLPLLTELFTLRKVCEFFHKLTQDDAVVPESTKELKNCWINFRNFPFLSYIVG